MNNEQQTWILKRPISVDDTNEYNLDFSGDYKWIDISGSEVDELFVPLNVSGLTRQVEELSKPLFVGGREGSTRWVDEDGLNKFVDRIVTLITQGEKE